MYEMKKYLGLLFLALLPLAASADPEEFDGIWYNLDNDSRTAEVTVSQGDEYYGEIEIPDELYFAGMDYKVTAIGESAFEGCHGLTAIKIPSSVTIIRNAAFYQCKALITLNIPEGVTELGDGAFAQCHNLTTVTIPSTMRYMGEYAFALCENLSTIISRVREPFEFDYSVFYSYAATLYVPEGTLEAYETTKEWKLFAIKKEISNIRTIDVEVAGTLSTFLPTEERYQIDKLVLTGALNGADIRFLRNISGIDFGYSDGTTEERFANISTPCIIKKLDLSEATIVSGGGRYYAKSTGSNDDYFYTESDILTKYIFSGCQFTSVEIPSTVTEIESEAFSNCPNLTSITIPVGITSISGNPFHSCEGLTSIYVADDNEHYNSRYDCNAIIETKTNTLIAGCKNTVIHNTVTSIGDFAFKGCKDLTTVTIPGKVNYIGRSAFAGCTGLTTIWTLNTEPPLCEWDYDAFEGIDKEECLVLVPEGSFKAYKKAEGWKHLRNIRETIAGDVNLDGEVNNTDANIVVAYIMGKDPEEFEDIFEKLADVNGDKKINVADVVMIYGRINSGK